MTDEMKSNSELKALAAEITAIYVSNNNLPSADLPGLIQTIYASLASLGEAAPEPAPVVERLTTAQINRSIRPEALISFIDGKPYKTLKKHVATNGLTFAEYKEKYGLPANYPATSPNYSAKRSAMAKSAGLGARRVATTDAAKAAKLKKTGRKTEA